MTFKKIYIVFLALLAAGIATSAYFSITRYLYTRTFIPIHSYKEIDISHYDKDTLVTLDVDDTLITHHDALAQHFTILPWGLKLVGIYNYPSLVKKSVIEKLSSIFYASGKYHLIEPEIPQFIESIKHQGCTVLGLTAMHTNSWGVIKSMPEWRDKQLKALAITFSNNFANQRLTELPKHRGNYPEIYEGILCANHTSKGDVLKMLLQDHQVIPKVIVSFDDQEESLISIAKACKEMKIKCICYHYLGAERLKKKLNTTRALKQISALFKEGRWLSDEEADALQAIPA
jgi:hypothetical protein